MEPKDSLYGPHRVHIPLEEKDEVEAESTDPPPKAETPPTLSMLWGPTAPDITSYMAPGDSSGKTPPRAETHPAFKINVGDLADSTNLLLGASTEMVTRYESLKALVMAADASHTVFGEQATYTDTIPRPRPNQPPMPGARRPEHEPTFAQPDPGPIIKEDPGVRKAAEKFGPMMYPGMKNVLMECANAIELVGRYIVLMNRAGTYYAHADHESLFPAPSGKPIAE
ncbi:hypothetical protein [Streptomyces sp. NPDC002067]